MEEEKLVVSGEAEGAVVAPNKMKGIGEAGCDAMKKDVAEEVAEEK